MNFWGSVIGGALNGAVETVLRPNVESLFGQLGLAFTDHGNGNFDLCVDGGVFGRRHLYVLLDGKITTLYLASVAEVSNGNVVAALGHLLLMRNKDLSLGSWLAREKASGNIGFAVSYAALTAGLDAVRFGSICESICEEVNAADKYMRSKGLI